MTLGLAQSLAAVPALAQVPATPALVSPNGSTGTLTPLYTWTAVSGVGTYQVWVNDALQNGRSPGT